MKSLTILGETLSKRIKGLLVDSQNNPVKEGWVTGVYTNRQRYMHVRYRGDDLEAVFSNGYRAIEFLCPSMDHLIVKWEQTMNDPEYFNKNKAFTTKSRPLQDL